MKALPKFFLLFLILLSLSSRAQDIQYYLDLSENSSNSQERLIAMDSVVSIAKRTDINSFINYSLQYIEIAKEMDSIEAAARKMINVHYSLSSVKNEPREALTIIDGILARKYKIKDSYLLGGLYLKRGGSNYKLNLTDAIEDYKMAIASFTEKDSLFIADAYLFSGQAYSNLGKFVPAGESYRKAYNYFEALKDYEYMFYAQQGITTMFSMNGFHEKAMIEREKNIKKIESLGLLHHLPTEYYNQALDYEKIGNKIKYLEYLFKAKEAIDNSRDNDLEISNEMYVYAELVDYYCESGQIAAAEDYLILINQFHENSQDDLITSSQYLGANARYHYAKAEYGIALNYAKQKLDKAETLKYEENILSSHKLLSDIYTAQGNFRKALEHEEAYSELKDYIYNKGVANSLAYYQTLYETEKNEKELVEQKASIQLLEKDNQTFKKLMIFGGVALLLLFGVILLYRNQLYFKNRKVMQEKFSQELIVSQEEERMRISKDLHDGLGQRLLVVKNKLMASGDAETKNMIDETIEEVRAISRDLHPFQLQELGITKALEHTITQIDENTTLFISSEIENIDNIFDQEAEVNIYRIVQESLSNVLKHAKAEASKISVKKMANFVVISIKDNGVGFDFSDKLQNVKSLGLKTLVERTRFLDGQMKVESKANNGTTLQFQFPIS
ncbi:sensor histidine kinase [Aureitalea sp. L0-47]|uniref:sensor histidine kinase n=1 Tax=Aureitalea sp. L0-47 TaxID=2816962 RepID=UPI0022386E32|nr:sensor histidine kinase [Aureitalea sp. L0-47]MCW5518945.1 sensor histidine kinase [Aureitalea sp. L0-47]